MVVAIVHQAGLDRRLEGAQTLQGNPSPFMAGLAKLLPLMLEGSKDAPLNHIVTVKFE
jgi:hypothetical protein